LGDRRGMERRRSSSRCRGGLASDLSQQVDLQWCKGEGGAPVINCGLKAFTRSTPVWTPPQSLVRGLPATQGTQDAAAPGTKERCVARSASLSRVPLVERVSAPACRSARTGGVGWSCSSSEAVEQAFGESASGLLQDLLMGHHGAPVDRLPTTEGFPPARRFESYAGLQIVSNSRHALATPGKSQRSSFVGARRSVKRRALFAAVTGGPSLSPPQNASPSRPVPPREPSSAAAVRWGREGLTARPKAPEPRCRKLAFERRLRARRLGSHVSARPSRAALPSRVSPAAARKPLRVYPSPVRLV
jgi:hypothetical protein